MALVEQAIFTSAETDRSAGYQVVAKSPGVYEADARELAVWGPSHDSLLDFGPDAASVNFHPLPSGAYCVSRTTAAGWEYSGRGGHRVYTHCLVVPPEVLGRFANNPFALLRAAVAVGAIAVHDPVPSRLDPLPLSGRAAPVDQTLLARLAASPGPQRIAGLVQAALDAVCLAVAGELPAEQLIGGLLSCLPPECRPEFSFSTGLKYSSRRPFRILALSGDPAEQRWVAHHPNVTVLDLSDATCASAPRDGWARLVERVLATGRFSFLASQLSKRRLELPAADLPVLGLQLLEELDASALRGQASDCAPSAHETEESSWPADVPGGQEGDPRASDAGGPSSRQHAHAAHQRFGKSIEEARTQSAARPSRRIKPDAPEVLQRLEHLDDLVYEAIGGQTSALDQLETLWPQVLAELGEEMVAESREQYLRYALTIWEECVGGDTVRNASRAMQALDVLCVLFNETV